MRSLLTATTLAAVLFCTPVLAESEPSSEVDVTATPVPLNPSDPAQVQVGRLRYLGGLQLYSSDSRFGGISGMRFLRSGELLAVTDAGSWITLKLTERGDRLESVRQVTIAPVPGLDSRPMRGKINTDAEALEIAPDGRLYVAFERRHRLQSYPSMLARARRVVFPDAKWLEPLPGNSGIEAMADTGSLWIYIAESTEHRDDRNALISRGGAHHAYNRVRIEAQPGFNPTDAHALDETHVLLLSRHFTPLTGAAAALQSFSLDPETLEPGEAPLVATIAPPLTVDNMEALAVSQEGERTFVYIASDNNFSPLQRTLLMKFELLGPAAAAIQPVRRSPSTPSD